MTATSKVCTMCSKEKPIKNFPRRSEGVYRAECKVCYNNKYREGKRKATALAKLHKIEWVKDNILGGKLACQHCGIEESYSFFDWHHKDPSTKLYNIGINFARYSIKKLKPELDKCLFLCPNCHRKEHMRIGGWL